MYSPDPSIVRQLKQTDSDLDVYWNQDRGRWIVTCMGKDAVTVQDGQGGYAPLDGRIVAHMREQAWIYRNKYETLSLHDRGVHIRNRERERIRKAQRRDDMRNFMKDSHQEVFGVGKFAGWGAGNRA